MHWVVFSTFGAIWNTFGVQRAIPFISIKEMDVKFQAFPEGIEFHGPSL